MSERTLEQALAHAEAVKELKRQTPAGDREVLLTDLVLLAEEVKRLREEKEFEESYQRLPSDF